jgi:hypothetical protein
MRRRNSRGGDPYWTEARFDSDCTRCGRRIKKGERIFYYPNGRKAYCADDGCGQDCSREFDAAAFDEAQYNGGW